MVNPRSGKLTLLPADQLVPGDIFKLTYGNRIPADGRLIESLDLEVDESNLTGEAKHIKKTAEAINSGSLTSEITGRTNIVHMGTLVQHGHGLAVVTLTGSQTELGKVCKLLKKIETPRTPLQNSMDLLGKQLTVSSFIVILIILLIGVLQGRNILDIFTIAVSLAVAAIPEGLPIVVTVTLALGVLRLSKRNAIVKRMPAVESLGSVNVICMDKTGTVTGNIMRVHSYYTWSEKRVLQPSEAATQSDSVKSLFRTACLCNNSRLDKNGKALGNPTEAGIAEFLAKHYPDERKVLFFLTQLFPRISELAFSHEARYMQVDVDILGKSTPFLKGALEVIIPKCKYVLDDGKFIHLSKAIRLDIELLEQSLSSSGARVLAFATGDNLDSLIFTGLMALSDPPRPDIKMTIENLMPVGVKFVMITGDSLGTATAIAEDIGIGGNNLSAMSGIEIDRLSEKEFFERIEYTRVFYRTSPAQKLVIVKAFQARGNVVAMTGDGGNFAAKSVNDAPALRLADIGISMGHSATDVAKEAADIILVDDKLSTLIPAIEEAKSIYSNIQHFLQFQLSTSVAALLLVATCTILGMDSPLNAMQILWISMIVMIQILYVTALLHNHWALRSPIEKLPKHCREKEGSRLSVPF